MADISWISPTGYARLVADMASTPIRFFRFACDSYRQHAFRQRRLSTDGLLEFLDDLGEGKDAQAFKTLSFAEDEEKAFEESTEEDIKRD